ncbi:MAG: Maf family protein [Proteobacteria bacterium]|nr:Maf family protein [Pseudomonadota bacterium]
MSPLRGANVEARPLVLASQSRIRRSLLEHAGVRFAVEPAEVDEAELRAAIKAEAGTAGDAAEALAALKAERVGRHHRQAIVLGCDQILDCGGTWFEKPADRAAAQVQLKALSGRSHDLLSAVVAFGDGARLWHHTGRARLFMRPLSDTFVEAYLDAMGEAALSSVGAYQLEGLGAQLFSRIEGDYFTILGLPLLPLLDFLRQHGLLAR